jgi:ankyrin repeat protein
LAGILASCRSPLARVGYEEAAGHELKPHRSNIPLEGVQAGFNQLGLQLTVSPTGDVVAADPNGQPGVVIFWPRVQAEVRRWKFKPFEDHGKAVTARIEEYVDLVPPERLPKNHVTPPALRPDSSIAITLTRTGCFGGCREYTVTLRTDEVVFEGRSSVVAAGTHKDRIPADDVRKLAKRFVDADFYSMDAGYIAKVTDSPGCLLRIEIDGSKKEVGDYVGAWEGMPGVITDLENEVDTLGRTNKWVIGEQGLVRSLKAEGFDFHSSAAQVMLKVAASRGQTATVREFLAAGTPLKLEPAPRPQQLNEDNYFQEIGWLNAASVHPETLHVLMEAGASKNDQIDKDLALANSAGSGNLAAVRLLISYGANPDADLGKFESAGGSALTNAARWGDPDVVREILRYHPRVAKRALFGVGEGPYQSRNRAPAECVRLLVEAGADVNARDRRGNTPLHVSAFTDADEELLKLGADVNARNDDGETPIFTTVDDDAIPLFVRHGADLTIRNKQGQTVMEAAKTRDLERQEALRRAIQDAKQR